MNAFLLMSVAMVSGADVAPAAAPTIILASHCGGCSTPAPSCSTCASTCDSGCGKASLLDRLKAKFASSKSCGCEKPVKACKPACAAPAPKCEKSCDPCASKVSLLDRLKAKFASHKSCGCETACAAPAPVCAPAPVACAKTCEPKCKPACGTPLFSGHKSCDSGCDKPSILDRLKAKFSSHKSCGCDSAPACGGCSTAAPAGCSLPPAPSTAPAPAPTEAPKVMPKPVETPKKTTSLIVPSVITPASSSDFIPTIPAPLPTKSPF
ncbi:hypothetical protein BH11PLA2_BH11PLA2_36350 [soil metagenome]